MNVRGNRFVVVAGGIASFICIAELIALSLCYSGFTKINKQLDQDTRRLSQLHERNPYPSMASLEAVKQNQAALASGNAALLEQLKQDPFPEDDIEATEFSARVQLAVERFRKRAEDSGIALPGTFEVGFARYASGGTVPEPKTVPRLARQLYSAECVVDALIRGGVSSIHNLSRDPFEMMPDADRSSSVRRKGVAAKAASARQNQTRFTASEVHPEKLYYIEKIGVSFSGTAEAVWETLHLLASDPHTMAVAEFAHSTQSGILQYNPEKVRRGDSAQDEHERFLSEGILSGSEALTRSERILAGGEVVQVNLIVDVYNFNVGADRR